MGHIDLAVKYQVYNHCNCRSKLSIRLGVVHSEPTVNPKKTDSSVLETILKRVLELKNDLVLKLSDSSLMKSISMRSHRSHHSQSSHRSGIYL